MMNKLFCVLCCAVELALEAGVPTNIHALNLLHQLVDDTPQL